MRETVILTCGILVILLFVTVVFIWVRSRWARSRRRPMAGPPDLPFPTQPSVSGPQPSEPPGSLVLPALPPPTTQGQVSSVQTTQGEVSSGQTTPRPRPSRPRPCPEPLPYPGLPSDPDASTSQTITRFPDVSMREKVALRQKSTLRVAVTQEPVRKDVEAYGMRFAVPFGAKSTTVDVLVTAEDFEIVGDDVQKLTIPVEGDSIPIVFEVIPNSIGTKKIKVEFFQNHKYIGGIAASTKVVMPGEDSDTRHLSTYGVVAVEPRSNPPDLTILITEDDSSKDQMRYKFRLHAPQHGLYYHAITEGLNFAGTPSKWVEGLYTELASLARTEGPRDLAETLSTIGADLYDRLFPRELKELWRKHISGRVKSIMIISDEPWIPWEIIKPSHETEAGNIVEESFLCEDYQLARWIAGAPPPCRLEVIAGAVVAPRSSGLQNAQREVAFLESRLRILSIPPRLESVRELLRYGGVQLIHFACHGSFDPDEHEQSVIYLENNEKLRSRDIAGSRRAFGRDRPFVFINVCQTARAEFSLVGIGSWANKFIAAQASGFLGSSWEVDDKLAYEFTMAFYQALIDGKTIGEAVKEARQEIRHEDDSTWLAYTVYADPLAKIVFA